MSYHGVSRLHSHGLHHSDLICCCCYLCCHLCCQDLRQTPSPCSSRPCFPVDNDATPRLHSVTRGSSCPGLGSIYHVTSLSTNALLSDDGQASSSIQPFRSLGTNATASPSSGDECELTRAGRFDELSGTPSATSSLKVIPSCLTWLDSVEMVVLEPVESCSANVFCSYVQYCLIYYFLDFGPSSCLILV